MARQKGVGSDIVERHVLLSGGTGDRLIVSGIQKIRDGALDAKPQSARKADPGATTMITDVSSGDRPG